MTSGRPDPGLRQLHHDLVALPGNSYGYFETRTFEMRVDADDQENIRALLRSSDYPYSSYSYMPEPARHTEQVDEQAFRRISGEEAAATLTSWVDATNALNTFIGPGAAAAETERRASLYSLARVVAPYRSLLATATTVFGNVDYSESPVRSVYTWHREWILIEASQIRCFSAFID